jgi:hypothetical protein
VIRDADAQSCARRTVDGRLRKKNAPAVFEHGVPDSRADLFQLDLERVSKSTRFGDDPPCPVLRRQRKRRFQRPGFWLPPDGNPWLRRALVRNMWFRRVFHSALRWNGGTGYYLRADDTDGEAGKSTWRPLIPNALGDRDDDRIRRLQKMSGTLRPMAWYIAPHSCEERPACRPGFGAFQPPRSGTARKYAAASLVGQRLGNA